MIKIVKIHSTENERTNLAVREYGGYAGTFKK